MSGKNQYPCILNWQSTDPRTGFLPSPSSGNSVPSGVAGGTMTGTATIYSQIIDVSRMDNIGIEYTYTGTPTGTLTVLVSNSGAHFYSWSPSPALSQPAGSAGGGASGLNQLPFKYLLVQYVNASGTGVLTATLQLKDLN